MGRLAWETDRKSLLDSETVKTRHFHVSELFRGQIKL